MFKNAVVNVLKRSWLLVIAAVVASTAGLYYRDEHISLFAVCLVVLAALGALMLVAVPVELHKLRNGR